MSGPIAEVGGVLIVGAGVMGSQIAMVTALAGYQVHLCDINQQVLERAVLDLRSRLSNRVDRGRMSAFDMDEAFGRLHCNTQVSEIPRVDLVIEASVEKLEHKRALFRSLSLQFPAAVLCSNSSNFVPSSFADVTMAPELVCNTHFFNPALVMPCVEVVRGPQTADQTIETVTAFLGSIGKEVVVLDKEIRGFVANRILNALRDEAIDLYERGIASIESIDTACRGALGHPMGPFELMDLTGLDINYLTKSALFAETGRAEHAPSRAVSERYERGELGRKSGRGWYVYGPEGQRLRVNERPGR